MLSALSHAWACWKSAPGVALLAVVALAVGIGSATAVFTVINGVLRFLDDLEGTRKALGYGRIVLFGLSYGTRAAYAYARRYPESVRAVVLVGPAPVSMRLMDGFGEDGRRSLDAIVADCLGDQRCSHAFPNLLEDAEHFRTSVSDPFRLLGLQTLQYSTNTAVLIPTLLKSAAAGDFAPLDSLVTGLRQEYLGQLALGLHLTIVCGEDLPFGEPDIVSALRSEYARACRGWPAAPVATDFHQLVRLSTPALVLVGEWDPATSPRWARVAADQFSPRHLVVFPKAGHALPAFGGCAGALVRSVPRNTAAINTRPSCGGHGRGGGWTPTTRKSVPPLKTTSE